jgi:hypothetical protein
MLWVAIGVAGAGYAFFATTKPYTNSVFWLSDWNGEPWAVSLPAGLAAMAWLVLPLPMLVAGYARLRGRGLRVAAWVGAWAAGSELMHLAFVWSDYPGRIPQICGHYGCVLRSKVYLPAIVSWGELRVCAVWLVLGAVMTCPSPPVIRNLARAEVGIERLGLSTWSG